MTKDNDAIPPSDKPVQPSLKDAPVNPNSEYSPVQSTPEDAPNKEKRQCTPQPTILHIGDARKVVDYDALSNATSKNTEFKKISRQKAGKCSEFLPEIVTDVISESKPQCLILQSGYWSVNKEADIKSSSDFELCKQQTIIAANNVFCSASRALNDEKTDVKHVIIMKLPLRKLPPNALYLSRLYNETLLNLHLKSPLQKKMSVLNDRYYKTDVTTDLVQRIATLFPNDAKSTKQTNATNTSSQRHNHWSQPKPGRGFQRRNSRRLLKVSSTNEFIMPTSNRFETQGN